jgi:hypothetical protein
VKSSDQDPLMKPQARLLPLGEGVPFLFALRGSE